MTDAFEQQLAEIEAANAGAPDQLEPGAGEQQKKPGEQEVDDESGASDDPLELTDEDEAVDADDDEEGGEEDEGEDGKRRRSKPAKQRIAELTAKLRDAERKLAAQNEPAEEAKEPVKPNPDDFEYGEADPKYIDAVTDYKLEVRDAERAKGDKQRQQQQAMMDRLTTGLAKAEAVGQDKYDDFDAKVAEAVQLRGEPLPPILSVGIAVSPVGHDLIYRLATDDAASERLEGLAKQPKMLAMALGELEGEYIDGTDDGDLDINDEMDMARMMGRMRARTSGKRADSPKKADVVVTSAPEPPAKRARGGAGKAAVKPDTDDINAFMATYGKDLGR